MCAGGQNRLNYCKQTKGLARLLAPPTLAQLILVGKLKWLSLNIRLTEGVSSLDRKCVYTFFKVFTRSIPSPINSCHGCLQLCFGGNFRFRSPIRTNLPSSFSLAWCYPSSCAELRFPDRLPSVSRLSGQCPRG